MLHKESGMVSKGISVTYCKMLDYKIINHLSTFVLIEKMLLNFILFENIKHTLRLGFVHTQNKN